MGDKTTNPDRVLVIGAGVTGRAVARFVEKLEARCFVVDDKASVDLGSNVEPIEPSSAPGMAAEVNVVVPSPGVPPGHPVIVAALAAGTPVVAELELAFRHLDGPVIAVTGTNGKSTTVSLVADILRCQGLEIFEGGNIGTPLCEAVGSRFDYHVVEASSFQLEWVDTFKPHVGVLLNISPDHLDRHSTMADYVSAKAKLFSRMDESDHAVVGSGEFGRRPLIESIRAPLSSFGSSLATADGTTFDMPGRFLQWPGRRLQLARKWPFAPHDFENAAAAAEVARCLGIGAKGVERALAEYQPMAHRLRLLGRHRGVAFWDDSKATNVGATLRSLEAFDGAVILLAGGVAKQADFSPLADAAAKLKLVVAFGEAGGDIAAAVQGSAEVVRAGSMKEAFEAAVLGAGEGDTVLLAPACASFDEFRDYAQRGEAFAVMVEEFGAQAEGLSPQ